MKNENQNLVVGEIRQLTESNAKSAGRALGQRLARDVQKAKTAKVEHFSHLENALRLMFEGSDIDRRMYLHRMARRYAALRELNEKYPYHGSVLRDES